MERRTVGRIGHSETAARNYTLTSLPATGGDGRGATTRRLWQIASPTLPAASTSATAPYYLLR